MEVKPRYKLTEVGVVPQDWEVARLGTLARAIYRGASPRPIDSPNWFDESSNVGWVRISDVTKSGRYLTDTEQRLSPAGIRNSRFVPSASLIMSICATVGRPVETRVDVCIHDGFIVFYQPLADQGFLFHVLKHLEPGWVGKGQTGSQMNLNTALIENTLVSLPPRRAEQEVIAEALSDADALIEALEHLLAKKRQLKQGAMQELLTGKKRLPGFSEEWREVALGAMGKCYRGVSYNPSLDLSRSDTASSIRLLRSNNVQQARVVFADMQYVDSRRVSSEQRLRRNDILVCMANGSRDLVGKAGHFADDDGFHYTFGAFMGGFRPNDQSVDSRFVFYLFQTEKYRSHIAVLLAGSSINNLTPRNVEGLVIDGPMDKSEQAAIAAVFSDMDAEIAALEEKLAKARQVKQGMMQELLTGKIRLPVDGARPAA